MRATIVVNPHAGKGRAPGIAKVISERLHRGGDRVTIINENDLDNARLALKKSLAIFPPDRTIVVGGDGNVHWSIQELAGTPSALEVVPTGTGNDFARTHGFSRKSISRPTKRKIDLGHVTFKDQSRYFGQILSTGFDSAVNQRANNMKWLRGRLKYTMATIAEIRSFAPIKYSLTIDGKRRNVEAIMVAVANGDSYGGGMKLVPHANPSDGELDILILHTVSKWELIKVFPKIFSGRHISHPAVETITAKRIIIDSNALVYADGEYVTQGKITVEIAPAALALATSS